MKVTKKNSTLAAAVGVIGGALLLVGCGSGGLGGAPNQLNDQGDIPQISADWTTTLRNADGFPNVTVMCFQGSGIITVTRDYNSAQVDPALDAFCASKRPATGPKGLIGNNH